MAALFVLSLNQRFICLLRTTEQKCQQAPNKKALFVIIYED
jgi:hypothetical protein